MFWQLSTTTNVRTSIRLSQIGRSGAHSAGYVIATPQVIETLVRSVGEKIVRGVMRTNFNGSGCRARYDGAESTRLYHHEVSIVSSHVQLRNTFGRWSSFVVEAIARIGARGMAGRSIKDVVV